MDEEVNKAAKRFFELSEQVRTQHHLNHDYPLPARRRSDSIIQAISQITGWHIIQRQIEKDYMPELRGMLMPFPQYQDFVAYTEKHNLGELLDGVPEGAPVAVILVSDANNTCWRRWTAVKEASHLLFEGGNSLTDHSDIAKLVSILVESASFTSFEQLEALCQDPEKSAYWAAESIGIIGALELYMPECSHKEWMAHAVNVEGASEVDIARRLMLPRRFVEGRMVQWGLIEQP